MATLSYAQLRDLRACASGNDQLAAFWQSDRAALALVTWRTHTQPYTRDQKDCQYVEVRVFPKGNQTLERHMFEIGATRRPQHQNSAMPKRVMSYEAYRELNSIFRCLLDKYPSVALVSHEHRFLSEVFRKHAFHLPKKVARIDLVEVLNFQTALGLGALNTDHGDFGKMLARTAGEWVRRYDVPRDDWNESQLTWDLLGVVGPEANRRMGAYEKIEKKQKALLRLDMQGAPRRREELTAKGRRRGEPDAGPPVGGQRRSVGQKGR